MFGVVRPLWFEDREGNLTLLEEEEVVVVRALQDESARSLLREVMRLSERERRIVLGIVWRFEEASGKST
jgi:hypothetical protein